MESPDLDKLLTGAQAAEFLGVKSATLYAYASRGQIVSMPSDNARERCYRLSDLIKLRQSSRGFKNVRETDAAVWTGPVVKSSITEIRDDGHRYRGQNAISLALAGTTFEQVAELLWDTDERQSAWNKVKPLNIPRQLKSVTTADGDFLDVLKLLLAFIELQDPLSRQLLSSDVLETARRLIVTMAIAPGLATNQSKYLVDGPYPLAQTLLAGLSGKVSPDHARAVNCALVLCADHELNASALAARIAASCDASLYSCLLSALGTFSGTLHGSASRRAEDMVSNSLQYKNTQSWMKEYLRQNARIPGFGGDIYSAGDPRARLLIEMAKNISAKNKDLNRLREIVQAVQEQLGEEPNLDIGLVAISYALALPAGSASTIFAVSRTAGWIAHAIEQRTFGGVIRPRAKYIGKT